MIYLSTKCSVGSQILRIARKLGPKPRSYGKNYRYLRDDTGYEARRNNVNSIIRVRIIRDIIDLEKEAANGFSNKELDNQKNIIASRKISLIHRINKGDFYKKERKELFNLINIGIDKIYDPYLNEK